MFSRDEIEVIRGVSRGWTESEMGARFGWPEPKVKQCLDQLLAKLKLSSRIELFFYANSEEGQAALRGSEL